MTALGNITTYTATSDCILCLQNYRSGAGSSYNSAGTHTYTIQVNGNTVSTDTKTCGNINMGGGYFDVPAFSYFLSSGDVLTIDARFTGKYRDNIGTATLIEF